VKFLPTLQHSWSKSFSEAENGNQQAFAMTVDSNGNVTIGGNEVGTMDFGGGPKPKICPTDGFVASFTNSGSWRWTAASVQQMPSMVRFMFGPCCGIRWNRRYYWLY